MTTNEGWHGTERPRANWYARHRYIHATAAAVAAAAAVR